MNMEILSITNFNSSYWIFTLYLLPFQPAMQYIAVTDSLVSLRTINWVGGRGPPANAPRCGFDGKFGPCREQLSTGKMEDHCSKSNFREFPFVQNPDVLTSFVFVVSAGLPMEALIAIIVVVLLIMGGTASWFLYMWVLQWPDHE